MGPTSSVSNTVFAGNASLADSVNERKTGESREPKALSVWGRVICYATWTKDSFLGMCAKVRDYVKPIFARKVDRAEDAKNIVNNKTDRSKGKLASAETEHASQVNNAPAPEQQASGSGNTSKTTKSNAGDASDLDALKNEIDSINNEILKIATKLPKYLKYNNKPVGSDKKDHNSCAENECDLIDRLKEVKKSALACLAKVKKNQVIVKYADADVNEAMLNALAAEERILLEISPSYSELLEGGEHLKNGNNEKKLEYWNKRLNNALNYLSNLAGSLLRKNNSNISELDDPHRAMKIADRYGALYDDEWTDALECIKDMPDSGDPRSEKEMHQILLNILMHAHHACEKDKGNKENSTKDIRAKQYKDSELMQKAIDDSNNKNIERMVGSIAPYINTEFINVNDEKMTKYVHKCVEVCWYIANQISGDSMIIDDPELISEGDDFNKQDYRTYTRTGDKVEYLLWPSLYLDLTDNRGLLAKGIVQCKSS